MGTVNPDARQHAAVSLPRQGDLLAGKYCVDKVIGVGGMGVVVAASHVGLRQQVAVKIMLPDLVENKEFAARFFREAQATASLRSEHVARIFDVGRFEDGAPYIVMELLLGEDLDRMIRRRGELPIEEAVSYVIEACEAVAEAHQLGIIHRDLKPGNLFLAHRQGAPPIIKLLDFGISKTTMLGPGSHQEEALTATDSTLGSPQYMSPEQLRSARTVDARTDLWSLGMILHRLLTGRVAFEADSVGGQLAMLIADPPMPLRRRRPDAPPELEAVILRCLQKDVTRRFQNAGQLARALAPFAPATARAVVPRIVAILGDAAVSSPLPPMDHDISETSTPSTWTPPANARPSRKGRLIGLTAGVALLVVALGLGALRLLGGAPKGAAVEPAVASATAVPTSPPSSAPLLISIQLTVEPSSAIVEIDGAPVKERTIRLAKDDRVHKLVVRAPGYETESRELGAQADTILTLSLKPQKESGNARPGRPSSPAPTSTGEPAVKKLKGPMETSL